MRIERNGIEIELTDKEMSAAYFEQQHKWDVKYITGNLLDQYIDGSDNEKDILMNDRLKSEPEFANKVAYRYRKYLEDAYGSDTEWNCLEYAYDYICECNGENPYPDLDGKTYWTEGDIHNDTTWSDFYDWLIDDMNEAEWLQKYWTTKIISVEYTGIDDSDVFEEEL